MGIFSLKYIKYKLIVNTEVNMAVQQRRVTHSRKGMRRSHHHLEEPTLTSCKKCGKKILPHRVCGSCGYYKNKKILVLEN